MSIEVDKSQFVSQLFTICDEEKVKSVWVVGSAVTELQEQFTIDSDIDVYVSVKQDKYQDTIQEQVSDRPQVTLLEDGGNVVREVDVHYVLLPDEKPQSARGRPVVKVH